MTERIDELGFTGDYTIFCPLRDGCCVMECPAYLVAADPKEGEPVGFCTARCLVGKG